MTTPQALTVITTLYDNNDVTVRVAHGHWTEEQIDAYVEPIKPTDVSWLQIEFNHVNLWSDFGDVLDSKQLPPVRYWYDKAWHKR